MNGASGHSRVVRICSRLVSLDSSNYGADSRSGERRVADYIVALLTTAGYQPAVYESAPGRPNVILRVPGRDRQSPAVLVHGHMDVVPAEPDQWSLDPFSGMVKDGYIWGRGASDMKDMVSSMLETLLAWRESGAAPERDIVFAFLADEEADGQFGSEWIVAEHPDLFEGVAVGLTEGGGSPVQQQAADGSTVRIYPVSTAERGTQHLLLTARGTSGHGSRPSPDSAVIRLVDALGRIAHHTWAPQPVAATTAFLAGSAAALGLSVTLDSAEGITAATAMIGDDLASYVRAARCSANPTVLRAGYKVNVVPGVATAEVDVRSVPGSETALLAELDELLGPDITREFISNQPGISAPIDSPWFAAIRRSIQARDPRAHVLPFCLGGGTDAKAFAKLGIAGYGFAPLGPNPDGPICTGEHGIDERVAVVSLEEGAAILADFLVHV